MDKVINTRAMQWVVGEKVPQPVEGDDRSGIVSLEQAHRIVGGYVEMQPCQRDGVTYQFIFNEDGWGKPINEGFSEFVRSAFPEISACGREGLFAGNVLILSGDGIWV